MSDREAFEKWYMSRSWVEAYDPLMKHDHGGYIVLETCEAWKAWQAAQAQATCPHVVTSGTTSWCRLAQSSKAQAQAGGGEAEPCGWIDRQYPASLGFIRSREQAEMMGKHQGKPLEPVYAKPQPAVNQQLLEALFDAAYCLDEAAELIADWGSYASEYFKERHDLKADIILCKNRAASLRAAIAAAQEQK